MQTAIEVEGNMRKVLLVGTCAVEPLSEYSEGNIKYDNHFFESYMNFPEPDYDVSEYDAVVVQLTLRHIFHQAEFPREGIKSTDISWARLESEEEARLYIDSCKIVIQKVMHKFLEMRKEKNIIFFPFLEPHRNYIGDLLDPYSLQNPVVIVRELNKAICEKTKEVPGFYFSDINDIFSNMGRINIQDGFTTHMSHASYMPRGIEGWDHHRIQGAMGYRDLYDVDRGYREVVPALSQRVSNILDILAKKNPVKAIIIDLDDTLWRGMAADDDKPDHERSEGYPLGIMEALLVYKKRGGILAICSKNHFDFIENKFDSLVGGALSLSDFASVKINFDSKSDNISDILHEINILPSNALFIDDNPREIEEVKSRFPEIRTLSASYLSWKNIIIDNPAMQVSEITKESADRTAMIKAKIQRDAEESSMSRTDWLTGLNLKCTCDDITDVNDSNFTRAFELINKTNQFNTTGKRWSLGELQALFDDGGYLKVLFVRDKLVNNGLVGIGIILKGDIVQVVISCRVLNLGVEVYLASKIVEDILRQHPKAGTVFLKTGKNRVSEDYFDRVGFKRSDKETDAGGTRASSWLLTKLGLNKSNKNVGTDASSNAVSYYSASVPSIPLWIKSDES